MKIKWLLCGLLGTMIVSLIFYTCIWLPTYSYIMVYASDGDLPTYYAMQRTNYCGAACLKMMEEQETGSSRSQDEIMNQADINRDGLVSDYEACAWLNNYISWGKYADYQRDFSHFLNDLKVLINSYEPLICGVMGSGDVDHWVFVIGYRIPFAQHEATPEGVIFADPASICTTWTGCVRVFYDYSATAFSGIFKGIYVGMAITSLAKTLENRIVDPDVKPLPQSLSVYTNYGTTKMAPGTGPDEHIPFADGSNGITDTMNGRIMRAADSVVAVWNAQQLININSAYQEQFEGAFACLPEKVTNMVASRNLGDIPGGDCWIVPYLHRSGNYYVGMVKIGFDDGAFLGRGIAGFIVSGAEATESQTQTSQAYKVTFNQRLVTRKVLHEMYQDCKFFPFWDLNELTGVDMLPFWYIQRPDASRFILDSWGNEMVRDAKTGILYLKSHLQNSKPSIPEKSSLSQNYPNPFNAETQIYFTVPKFSEVKLEIFNVKGQRIKILINGEYQAGEYRITWNGTNQNEQKVTSGVYFYKCQIGSLIESRKMIMLK